MLVVGTVLVLVGYVLVVCRGTKKESKSLVDYLTVNQGFASNRGNQVFLKDLGDTKRGQNHSRSIENGGCVSDTAFFAY